MRHLHQRLPLLFVSATLLVMSACNFSDPVSERPDAGCEKNAHCNHNGTCEVARSGIGTCACDEGYAGETCDTCADGFVDVDGDCVDESTICTEGQIEHNGECRTDPCLDNPACGEGVCKPLGPGMWECECPGQIIASTCSTCEDTCENGTCDAEGVCMCDTGFAGENCDRCADGFEGQNCDRCEDGAFGPECLTCAELTSDVDWWDDGYAMRRPIVVFNPTEETALDDTVLPFTFAHNQIVTAGGDDTGQDVRMVFAGTEIDRVLGFDSRWNNGSTEILFATAEDIPPGEMALYFIYAINPDATAPMPDPAELFASDRGWFTYEGLPIYSPRIPSSSPVVLQVRQKSPNTLQLGFHDGTDETGLEATAVVTDVDGNEIGTAAFDNNVGSRQAPRNAFEDISDLPDFMTIELTITPGLNPPADAEYAFVAGPRELFVGTSDELINGQGVQQIEIERTGVPMTVPSTFACPPEERE